MVHNNVENDADAFRMCEINELAHFINGSHVLVHRSEIECIVAVEAVVSEIALSTAYPAMHLLPWSCNPDGIRSKVGEVAFFKLLR
ncbi:hypothetical protein PAECIP111893_05333 [Paenibacillus plantiphilus]|uniref:Uncharacterized protein n=1 Tax=Paenibacillus plantiphilus TaxID=2905650 RepID=A0ABM9CY77_9BACL|nr:hypothetical protein PAECIP111893_05333 [Paenibacillus plantiphilus]